MVNADRSEAEIQEDTRETMLKTDIIKYEGRGTRYEVLKLKKHQRT